MWPSLSILHGRGRQSLWLSLMKEFVLVTGLACGCPYRDRSGTFLTVQRVCREPTARRGDATEESRAAIRMPLHHVLYGRLRVMM